MNGAPDSSITLRNVAIGVAILAVVASAVYVSGRGTWWAKTEQAEAVDVPQPQGAPDERPPGATEGPMATGPDGASADGLGAADRPIAVWTERIGQPPVWPGSLSVAPDCSDAEESLAAVCAALDSRHPELVDLGGSCVAIRQAIEELSSRPPDLRSELVSHSKMLANVFYLFRVLGRDRVELLREVLVDESVLAEPGALALYRWVVSRDRCGGEESAVGVGPSYEYAGWLFTTLGGQAYLRRRAPVVESLACLYGVAILDRATSEGRNSHGIDLRAELVRCRQLLAVQPLVFRDRYLEELDAIAERWESR